MAKGKPLDLLANPELLHPNCRWTVLSKHPERASCRVVLWRCRCHCGAIGLIPGGNLRKGLSTQCADCAAGNRTHGMSRTPMYPLWLYVRSSRQPVSNTVPRWDDFTSFLTDVAPDHSDGSRPTGPNGERLYLHRPDESRPWGPDNFRWDNRTGSNGLARRFQTVGGVTHCLSDWARMLGVTCERVRQLANRNSQHSLHDQHSLEREIRKRAEFHGVSTDEVLNSFTTYALPRGVSRNARRFHQSQQSRKAS